jgi:hypothetical protein
MLARRTSRCPPDSLTTGADSFKRVLDRRRSVLEEAPFIDLVPEPHVKGVSIAAVITARNFDALALVLPGERFRRSHERATNAPPPMSLKHDQSSYAREVPRRMKEWKYVNTDNSHDARERINGDERGVGGAALQPGKLAAYECRRRRISERSETPCDRVAIALFGTPDCDGHS